MSKTLYIVRHGKSSWVTNGMLDVQRPLKKTGVIRTEIIGNHFKKNNISVDLIISSHAVRAYETALIVARYLEYPANFIQTNQDIYFGNMDKVLEILYKISDKINNLMIFGHNPTFTHLANQFLSRAIDYLPTTGVVATTFKTDQWNEILNCPRSTKFYLTPKLISNINEEEI